MRYAMTEPLLPLFEYLEQRNVRPEQVFGPGIVAFVRERVGARVPARLGGDLLERCAVRLEDPLFGLRYGQFLDPKAYGPMSLIWRYAPSFRHSNRATMRIMHLHDEGVAVTTRDEGELTTLIFRRRDGTRDKRQFVECGVSAMLRISRLIMGPSWVPLRASFTHDPAASISDYETILGAPASFGARENGLTVKTSDFDRPSPNYDAEILTLAEQSLLRAAGEMPLPFRDRLDQIVDDLLAVHQPRLDAAASAMAMSGRTLQRHLSAEGISFRHVVAARRRIIINAWMQRKPRPSLTLLAERIAVSDASAAARLLRHPEYSDRAERSKRRAV